MGLHIRLYIMVLGLVAAEFPIINAFSDGRNEPNFDMSAAGFEIDENHLVNKEDDAASKKDDNESEYHHSPLEKYSDISAPFHYAIDSGPFSMRTTDYDDRTAHNHDDNRQNRIGKTGIHDENRSWQPLSVHRNKLSPSVHASTHQAARSHTVHHHHVTQPHYHHYHHHQSPHVHANTLFYPPPRPVSPHLTYNSLLSPHPPPVYSYTHFYSYPRSDYHQHRQAHTPVYVPKSYKLGPYSSPQLKKHVISRKIGDETYIRTVEPPEH